MVIGVYYINGYQWLIILMVIVAIVLMAIDVYFINGY
jgi:hypothetical protein